MFAIAGLWGGVFWAGSVRAGHHPFFYQSYFEPAVLLACGKGFLLSDPQPAPLRAFILEEADTFSCDDLPKDLTVGTKGLYQRPWRYLMTMVAVAWMVLGISWSGLAPLFGVLYGLTTALAYANFRLIVGRVAALAATTALTVSTLQLTNLPNLRDYAKAPLTLALVFVLVALAVRPWRPRAVLLLSLAYGLILGIGYGFRTDLLIDIPPFLITMALFMPGGVLRNLPVKIAAIGLCAAGFIAAGWPIITSVVGSGGCQWHPFLVGFTAPFDEALGVSGGSYGWGHLPQDDYVWTTVSSYASRFHPDLGPIEYCSREYDVASGAYLRHLLTTFPADLVTRAYAAVLNVVDLPFRETAPPFTSHAVLPYRLRGFILGSLSHAGPWLAGAFVLVISWSRLRLALFASFVILYFGGYPSIQFGVRHYFHLEFIGWAVLAFLAERGIRLVLGSRLEGTPAAPPAREGVPRLIACAVLLASVLLVPLAILRSYQGVQVTRLLESYVRSPAEPLALVGSAPGQFRVPAGDRGWLRPGTLADGPRNPETRFVQAVVNGAACRPGTTVTFRYDPARPDDFSYAVPLDGVVRSGSTRIFEAVYDNFQGLDVSDSAPGCLQEVLVLTHLEQFPLLLPARLSPGWEGRPQYQRITFFGGARR